MTTSAQPARLRPDEELAALATAIAEAEGISYAAALDAAAKRYPDLMKRYAARAHTVVKVTTQPADKTPQSATKKDDATHSGARASEELAALAATLIRERGLDAAHAQDLVLDEHPDLASRYYDEVTGADPFRELAELADRAMAAGRCKDFRAGCRLVLAERPALAARIDAYSV